MRETGLLKKAVIGMPGRDVFLDILSLFEIGCGSRKGEFLPVCCSRRLICSKVAFDR